MIFWRNKILAGLAKARPVFGSEYLQMLLYVITQNFGNPSKDMNQETSGSANATAARFPLLSLTAWGSCFALGSARNLGG